MTLSPYGPTELAFLQANSNAYEWLIDKIVPLNATYDREVTLRQVVSAAAFAARCHTGRFADGFIENIALEIGSNCIKTELRTHNFSRSKPKKSLRHVLHVTRLVDRVGGHTRMLYHWLQNDNSSCHSVVLLDQLDPIPRWFSDAVLSRGGFLVQLQAGVPLLSKAAELAAIVKQNVDLVVLHHFPYDVVPTVAFAVNDCPPVTILNHADHTFWLGSSVADMVINLRTAGADHTARRRFIPCNTVLPIPLLDEPRLESRADAREALGIPENQIVLLSVGRAEKYQPSGKFDFVSTVSKILDHEKNAHLYVVGVSETGIKPFLRTAIHDRLHFVGSLEDPSRYRNIADVYLESFPYGSTTALLEAALSGLPVVPAYTPLFPLLVGSADSLSDLLPNPNSEQDYIKRALFLIGRPDEREELGQTLRSRLLADHVGEGWRNRLEHLYTETDRLEHAPGPIPMTSCLFTSEDIGLSMWNVYSGGQTLCSDRADDQRRALLVHIAVVSKQVGQFTKARQVAWRAVQENPYRLALWLLVIKAMLGRSSPAIRYALDRCKIFLIKIVRPFLVQKRSNGSTYNSSSSR